MKTLIRISSAHFGLIALAALAIGGLPASADNASNQQQAGMQAAGDTTAQLINQNPDSYLGQHVAISGKVDRVIGPGAFIIGDPGGGKDMNHRILVLVPGMQGAQNAKQQGGTVALPFKDGDQLKIQGKVERLTLGSETETIQPKAERETVSESVMTMPVVIVQPAAIQKTKG